MTYLLDVNALIALIDPTHANHDVTHQWFAADGGQSWATCPITENGILRIVGNARYPNSPGSPAAVAGLLARLKTHAGHVFWPDNISLLDASKIDAGRLLTHAQITDSYLLALAVAHRGMVATLDRRLTTTAVAKGQAALHQI